MGKTGKWFKSFLTGKKDKVEKDQKKNVICNVQQNSAHHHQQQQNPATPVVVVPRPTTPKEKKRWSFRRSSANAAAGPKDPTSAETTNTTATVAVSEHHQEKQDVNVGVEAAAADAAMIQFNGFSAIEEEAAATKIQSVYRSYLARKALKALRGLVKLQALVRGHLVRKQATATLRCMQALVTAQARARAQRVRSVDDAKASSNHRQSTHRRHSHEKIKHSHHDVEEDIKIVEMDRGEFRTSGDNWNSYTVSRQEQDCERMDSRMRTYYSSQGTYTKQEYQHISPAPSAITEMSPRTCSGHFEDYSFATAQSSPQCYSAMSRPDPSRTPFSFPQPDYAETMSYDYLLYPNYMANTESSRAKARSQSAPKQRPEFERQPSRGRRPSVEGRSNIPKGARMQRSSSHVGSTANHYPWSVKLDKSMVSLKDSECGSTCSVLTNANYCTSLVSYDPRY